jgi:hypothetical protein
MYSEEYLEFKKKRKSLKKLAQVFPAFLESTLCDFLASGQQMNNDH